MPRQAHGRSLQNPGPSKPPKRKPIRGRGLNALQIAESENLERVKVNQQRLGESYDDPEEPRTHADAEERSSKRRKVAHEAGEEESDSGSDLEGERWHVGIDEEDEDSDIDSDDAFGGSDEDRFADFVFRGSKGNATESSKTLKNTTGKVTNTADLQADGENSSGDAEDDDLGEDAVDLATALDMNEAAEDEDFAHKKSRRRAVSPGDGDGSSAGDVTDESELSDEELDRQSELSVSDQDDGDHDRLQSFVQSLSKKKEDQLDQKINTVPSRISAADLLQYVKDPQQRQSLKILQNNEVKSPELYKGGIPGRLAPPLAKRQQDRLDRVAAYDKSKKEMGKWVETVKQNRRAEHLMFPLVDPESVGALNNSQMPPISQSQPISSLETKIQEIMQESSIPAKIHQSAEQEEQEFEELQEKKMPLVEVQARRAELRKARDLLFREEIRAKRIKKIKSKAYRRIHRKERDRAHLQERAGLAASGLLDSDEEREKNDPRRAEERMGARHRESKWAKAAKATGRAAWDDDTRGAVTDLARRDEELRRRIEGKKARDSAGSESESDSDGYDSEADDQDLEDRLAAVESAEANDGTSKLESMAFMKRAEAARKSANDTEIREIRHQLRNSDDDHFDDKSEGEDEPVVGRQKFGGKYQGGQPASKRSVEKSEFEERLSEDDEQDLSSQNAPISSLQPLKSPIDRAVKSNKTRDSISHQTSRPNKPSQKSTAAPKSKAHKSTNTEPPKPTLKQTKPKPQVLETPSNPLEASSDSEPQAPDPMTSATKEPATLSEAIFFGDDDLLPAFEAEKRGTAADEDDQPLDNPNALPGWGSWTGAGISKKTQKRSLAHAKKYSSGDKVIPGVKPQDRRDATLERVIVNEKKVKKNSKYLATELPHPFESRAQYERSLRVPMGPEWTTKATFQDGVKPRVLLRQGVIRAVGRPMA